MLIEIGREGEPGKPLEWSGERALVIGRGRNAEMVIQDPLLSRRHCQLEMSGGAVLVHDLGSANGTFINGIQATRAAIQPGDVVTFGRSWLRVVPEAPQVKIGAGPASEGNETTRRFDKRAAKTAPERQYDSAGGDDEVYPRIEGYDVFGTIGKGSFGTVFRAKSRKTGRLVAIKVIPTGANAKPENVARFLREIEATGQLHHPNLVGVHGAGEAPHFAYLVMEYVEGETLARLLQREGSMTPLRALEVGRQVASALEHAFSRGFVHRDVKPENILVDQAGIAKLCDFGLVKNLAASSGANLTRPGQGFGSLAYMPPEQVREAARADQRADVYSLGATLYNMLTGRRPFSGPVNKGLLRRIMEEYPDPIPSIAPDVPPEAASIVERCLMKDPAQRYQSPRELREAIESCLRVASTGVERVVGTSPPGGPRIVIGSGPASPATDTSPSRPLAAPSGDGVGAAAAAPAAVSTPAPAGIDLGRAPTGAHPAAPAAGADVASPGDRIRSVSDTDAFDDFARDLAPIGTDSNPVLRLPLPGAAAPRAPGEPATPPAAAAGAGPPAAAAASTPAPAPVFAAPHSRDPFDELFPHSDETRRTATPPFLAFGRTGLPRRIETSPPTPAAGDAGAPARPSAEGAAAAPLSRESRPSATDTADVPPPLVADLPPVPRDPNAPPLTGAPLPEVSGASPPSGGPAATAAVAASPPAAEGAGAAGSERKEGLIGRLTRRIFKGKRGAAPGAGGAGGAPS
jgi:serine/threonine-protein kinase